MNIRLVVIFILLCMFSLGHAAEDSNDKALYIYHDADYSNHKQSAESMLMGINTALHERNNQLQGYTIKVIPKDHRGNTVRSMLAMKSFLKDPQALLILGGLHSPPYIKNRTYINENGILLLVPWAAGGPITRYANGTNWVFRLSIDDTKAGKRLASYARDSKGCQRPHLLLEDTPWGDSNYKTISRVLIEDKTKDNIIPTSRFNWGAKENVAKIVLRNIIEQGADCILYVGNAIEGEQFAKAMLALDASSRIPIISHWGITGGNFQELVNAEMRKGIDLSFIQTCFSFMATDLSPFAESVLDAAKKRYPEKIKRASDIPAPPGFIHSYDIGRLLVAAIDQIKLTGEVDKDRESIRRALENLQKPVAGLLKTYNRPFATWSPSQPDAHEALNLADFCMAVYDENNNVIVSRNKHHISLSGQ